MWPCESCTTTRLASIAHGVGPGRENCVNKFTTRLIAQLEVEARRSFRAAVEPLHDCGRPASDVPALHHFLTSSTPDGKWTRLSREPSAVSRQPVRSKYFLSVARSAFTSLTDSAACIQKENRSTEHVVANEGSWTSTQIVNRMRRSLAVSLPVSHFSKFASLSSHSASLTPIRRFTAPP